MEYFIILALVVVVTALGVSTFLSRTHESAEIVFNKAVERITLEEEFGIPVSWACEFIDVTGRSQNCRVIRDDGVSEDWDCGMAEAKIPEDKAEELECIIERWWDEGCRLCGNADYLCASFGICNVDSKCYNKNLTIAINFNDRVRELGICVGWNCTRGGWNVCPGMMDGRGAWYSGRCYSCPRGG
ncbi:MAG: hypothetical protein AB1629_04985 [Candidatus Omnitrophota bacterium]